MLTAYLVIHGYLRDVGWYIRDLQHAVNEMEEMVAIGGQPFGVADRPGAPPIAITGGENRVRERALPLSGPRDAAL